MSDINDFVFPGVNTKAHPQGLKKREYFAAKAMQGLLARPRCPSLPRVPSAVARDSVRYADALLAELASEVESTSTPAPLSWVSVKERLPTKEDADEKDCVLWATDRGWWENYYHVGSDGVATHWCRPPALPLPSGDVSKEIV